MNRSWFIYGIIGLLCLGLIPATGAGHASIVTHDPAEIDGQDVFPDHCSTVPDRYPCDSSHDDDENTEGESPTEGGGGESSPRETENTEDEDNGDTGSGGEDSGNGPIQVDIPNPLSVDFSPPNAREVIASVARDGQRALYEGTRRTINNANSYLFSLPAPGQPDDPSTWVNPERGWWSGVTDAYWALSFIAILTLIPWTMLAMGQDARRQRATFRRVAVGFGMILAGPVVMPMGYHVGSVFAQAIAPSGTEFLQTPGNLARLGIGIGMALVIAYVNLASVLLALIAYYTLYVVAFFVAALWPLYWGLYAAPFRTLQTAGSVGIGAYMTLPIILVTQTSVLRILFSLPLEGLDIVTTVIVTVGGLIIGFFVLPRVLFNRLAPRAVAALSRSIDRKTVDRVKKKRKRISKGLRQQFQQARPGVHSRIQDVRSRVSGTSSVGNGGIGVPSRRRLPSRRTPRLPEGDTPELPGDDTPQLPARKPADREDGNPPQPTPRQRQRKQRRIDQATDPDRFSN